MSKQWIKNPKIYSKEESLRELCLRYFTSHGPATLEDLQRWSGL
ncbi:MAG: winged helix DNA-binding domain-containing protein [Candidatus Peribacteria bacterium]|nr:MAG: winged helix DNA-binding domain-containing protein [Candidatus Peribacteria bacterium]